MPEVHEFKGLWSLWQNRTLARTIEIMVFLRSLRSARLKWLTGRRWPILQGKTERIVHPGVAWFACAKGEEAKVLFRLCEKFVELFSLVLSWLAIGSEVFVGFTNRELFDEAVCQFCLGHEA